MAPGRIGSPSKMMLLASAAWLGSCGQWASSEEREGYSVQRILGGQVDTTHSNVFMLVANQGQVYSSCTATLIAPNLLLTARHCVSPNEDEVVVCGRAELGVPFAPENLRASNAVNVRQSTRWFTGASVHVPSESADTCGFDVALVVLTENVPSDVADPAIPRIDREVEQGETYVAVGYGLDEEGQQGGRLSLGGLYISCSPGECGRVAPGSEFIGDTGVCEGDSGGPAFDTAGKLVGVVSRGGEDCSIPIYGTVTAWKALISSVAVQAAARGAYPAPFWATSGVSDLPPPPSEPGGSCSSELPCEGGFVCHQDDETGAQTCVPACSREQDCDAGFACTAVETGSACLPNEPARGPEPAATCAYPAGGSRGSPLLLFGLASGFGWLGARRRRTRAS